MYKRFTLFLMTMLICCAAASGQAKPNIVLVHGAFSDASAWNGVATHLRKDGFKVYVSANPLRGIEADRDSLAGLLKSIDGPIVLVGHSYGGVVISNSSKTTADVRALVFVSAVAPDEGESIGELAGKFPGSKMGTALSPSPLADGSVDLYVRRDQFRAVLAADVRPDLAEQMAFGQRPAAQATLVGKSGTPLWRTVPNWFVYGDSDLSLPPALYQFFAERAGSRKTVVIKGGSHNITVSHPKEVVEVIEDAAAVAVAKSPVAPSKH